MKVWNRDDLPGKRLLRILLIDFGAFTIQRGLGNDIWEMRWRTAKEMELAATSNWRLSLSFQTRRCCEKCILVFDSMEEGCAAPTTGSS